MELFLVFETSAKQPISSEADKSKNHILMRMWFMMVEARGFEPLSEDNATQASTGVVTVLMSPERRPVTDYALGQPDYLLPSTPGGDRSGVSHYLLAPSLVTWAMLGRSTLTGY